MGVCKVTGKDFCCCEDVNNWGLKSPILTNVIKSEPLNDQGEILPPVLARRMLPGLSNKLILYQHH